MFIKGRTDTNVRRNPVVDLLLRQGVNQMTAKRLATQHPAEQIEHHVRVLDWILRQPNTDKPASPAGYLVESIRQTYAPPVGFQAKTDITARQSHQRVQQSAETRLQRRVAAYLKKLTGAERKRLEKTALATASEAMLEAFRRARHAREPLLIDVYHRLIVEAHVKTLLARR